MDEADQQTLMEALELDLPSPGASPAPADGQGALDWVAEPRDSYEYRQATPSNP
jgi:hypothetical protein